MSLLVAILAAAGAGVAAGALFLRSWRRRRLTERGERPRLDPSDASVAPAAPDVSRVAGVGELWLGRGDVVEIGGESHWLCVGTHLREAGAVRAGIWWPGPGRTGTVVVELPKPERRVYLLHEAPTPLPPGSPTRLELGGSVMDRRRSFPAVLERSPGLPPELSEQGTVSLYEAASGAVAVVLQTAGGNLVAWGRSYELGEIDRLGQADPSDEAPEPVPEPVADAAQRHV